MVILIKTHVINLKLIKNAFYILAVILKRKRRIFVKTLVILGLPLMLLLSCVISSISIKYILI